MGLDGGINMLEKMDSFFEARVEGYDEHMINNVEGCKEAYEKMAELIPGNCLNLLDLGCGTGLELDKIFKKNPEIKVTGVDLTKAMLDKLKEKYKGKEITLINENYFNYNFDYMKYDVVISFQTMHHFYHEQKIYLYTKIYNSLKDNGKYIECDYMVCDQKEEDYNLSEYERIKEDLGIEKNEFYHYDIPCTINNEIEILRKAGFRKSKMLWRKGDTTIIEAIKSIEPNKD